MSSDQTGAPPIFRHKHYEAPSALMPESLLREARRQKNLPTASVPQICILDAIPFDTVEPVKDTRQMLRGDALPSIGNFNG